MSTSSKQQCSVRSVMTTRPITPLSMPAFENAYATVMKLMPINALSMLAISTVKSNRDVEGARLDIGDKLATVSEDRLGLERVCILAQSFVSRARLFSCTLLKWTES